MLPIKPRLSITISISAFCVRKDVLCVFLMKKDTHSWSLPYRLIGDTSGLEEVAGDILETDMEYVQGKFYIEQLYTFDFQSYASFEENITISYLALIPNTDIEADKNAKKNWFSYHSLPLLSPGHEKIIQYAYERLRGKLGYTNVAFGLLPNEFTLTQLQRVYEIILGREFDKRNFRRKMLLLAILESTGKKQVGHARPAEIFRFRKRTLTYVEVL